MNLHIYDTLDLYMKENPIDVSFYMKIIVTLYSLALAMCMLFGSELVRSVAAVLIVVNGLFLSTLPDFVLLFMLKSFTKKLK